MKVQFIKSSSFQTAGPQGPGVRIFAIGEVVDLPELHARMVLASGEAQAAAEKPAKVEAVQVEAKATKAAPKRPTK